MTADVQGDTNGYVPYAEALYYNILKTLEKFDTVDALPENPTAKEELDAKMASFTAPLPCGELRTSFTEKVHGEVYKTTENLIQIDSFYLTFGENEGVFHYHTPDGHKGIPFGFGAYKISPFPEKHYSGRQIQVPLGHGYRSMSAAAWVEAHKLALRTYIIDDYFGNLNITFSFKDNMATAGAYI